MSQTCYAETCYAIGRGMLHAPMITLSLLAAIPSGTEARQASLQDWASQLARQ